MGQAYKEWFQGTNDMDGAKAKELADVGFEADGTMEPFPYVLVSRGGGELEEQKTVLPDGNVWE